MEAGTVRRLKSGEQYDHLFPRCTGEDKSIKDDAKVEDTLRLIRKTVPKTLWHTKKIAGLLQGKNLDETCSNIWHFVYDHIAYRKDEDGCEQIRSPRRTWRDRKRGVDCDCYTEFISSVLTNLGIAHKGRITIYDYDRGYQHIYIVVPKDGKLGYALRNRRDYIVLDCVKDAYDDEQPFIECKDYNMKLEYLDGIEPARGSMDEWQFDELYEDQIEMGGLNDMLQKVGGAVKTGVRAINRVANPTVILLRNGFLASMKLNIMNVAEKLRFGYLTEDQARRLNMDIEAWKKLLHIKEKAETIYYQAGGKKENLREAILKGKGNQDGKVPLSGLSGIGDYEEQLIINSSIDGLGQLGEVVTAAALAAAASAVGAISLALKQLGSLFKKDTPQSASPASSIDPPINFDDYNYVPQNPGSAGQAPVVYTAPAGGGTLPAPPSGVNPYYQATVPYGPGAAAVTPPPGEESGIMGWAKKNTTTLLVGTGLAIGSAVVLHKVFKKKNPRSKGMSGLPRKSRKKRKRIQTRKTRPTTRRSKIKAIKL